MLYSVQFATGPAIDIEATDRERAWDEYKRLTGLRRVTYPDQEPRIIAIPPELQPAVNHGPDSSGTSGSDDGPVELRDQAAGDQH
jgi:hypothetical protein